MQARGPLRQTLMWKRCSEDLLKLFQSAYHSNKNQHTGPTVDALMCCTRDRQFVHRTRQLTENSGTRALFVSWPLFTVCVYMFVCRSWTERSRPLFNKEWETVNWRSSENFPKEIAVAGRSWYGPSTTPLYWAILWTPEVIKNNYVAFQIIVVFYILLYLLLIKMESPSSAASCTCKTVFNLN